MKALLARPHDFIVEEMKQWLSSLGLEPVRLSALKELALHGPETVGAIVISTAVTSSVPATLEESLREACRRFPEVPLVLAGLPALESARSGVGAELKRLGLALHGVDEAARWGTPGVALYVQQQDLKGERVAATSAAARQHLKGASR